jgi:uncharacterized membrane protein
MSRKDTLLVFGAAYDNVSDAEVDYEAIKSLYYNAGTSRDFDAAVIQRDEDGKRRVVRKHEQPTRHGAAVGLAIGAASAIFPGIGLIGGAAAGAVIGAVTGHMKGGMSDSDLKQLAGQLDRGQVGLIAVYSTNMADEIAASVKAESRFISEAIDAKADDLAKQIKAAGAEG